MMPAVGIDPDRVVKVRHQHDRGVDPICRIDSREPANKKPSSVPYVSEFPGGDGGDHDPTDDKEQVDSENTRVKRRHPSGSAVVALEPLKVSQHNQHSCDAATYLNA